MNDDHRIRRLLRDGDPAASLPDLTLDRIRRLTEDAMTGPARTTAPRTPDDGGARTAARRPRARTLGGAVGLLGVAAAAAIALPLVLATPAAPTALRAPTVSGGLAGACAPVSADVIARADTAFRGEVVSIDGGTVTLRVRHAYAGDPGTTVTVPQGGDTALDGGAPVFVAGTEYLVAASGGVVLSCGSTAADGPELRRIYDRAFAR